MAELDSILRMLCPLPTLTLDTPTGYTMPIFHIKVETTFIVRADSAQLATEKARVWVASPRAAYWLGVPREVGKDIDDYGNDLVKRLKS